jgi:hypothetical protein
MHPFASHLAMFFVGAICAALYANYWSAKRDARAFLQGREFERSQRPLYETLPAKKAPRKKIVRKAKA